MDGLKLFQELVRQEGVVTVPQQNETVATLFNALVEKKMREEVSRALIASQSGDQPMTGACLVPKK
jgi:hypothetical protein